MANKDGHDLLATVAKCLSHLVIPTEVFSVNNPVRQFILGPAGIALATIMMLLLDEYVILSAQMLLFNFASKVAKNGN